MRKSELKGRWAGIEDEVIARLLEAAPREVKLTLLADRGFADQEPFSLLSGWEIDYVIRLRGVVVSSGEGETLPAQSGLRPMTRRDASVTSAGSRRTPARRGPTRCCGKGSSTTTTSRPSAPTS